MHKGESRSWICLGNPRSSWMWNTVTTAAILVLASPPSPDMLSSMHASWVSLQGEVWGRSGDKQASIPCMLTESSCLYFPHILLLLCWNFYFLVLYSCVLIKIASYLRVSIRKQKTSVSLEGFFNFYNLAFKQVDKGKLLLVYRVQWIDAFRHGLLADGKYRAALSWDRDGRLSFFP